jgi:hypothetical protein
MIAIIKQNSILPDIFEEIVALLELGVDIPQAVDDRAEWRCDLFLNALLNLSPEAEIFHRGFIVADALELIL